MNESSRLSRRTWQNLQGEALSQSFIKVARSRLWSLESVYKGAMMLALEEAGIRAASKVDIPSSNGACRSASLTPTS